MAFGLAVYASQCGLPRPDARLASGRWSGATGRAFTRRVPMKGFRVLPYISSSFPKLCLAQSPSTEVTKSKPIACGGPTRRRAFSAVAQFERPFVDRLAGPAASGLRKTRLPGSPFLSRVVPLPSGLSPRADRRVLRPADRVRLALGDLDGRDRVLESQRRGRVAYSVKKRKLSTECDIVFHETIVTTRSLADDIASEDDADVSMGRSDESPTLARYANKHALFLAMLPVLG